MNGTDYVDMYHEKFLLNFRMNVDRDVIERLIPRLQNNENITKILESSGEAKGAFEGWVFLTKGQMVLIGKRQECTIPLSIIQNVSYTKGVAMLENAELRIWANGKLFIFTSMNSTKLEQFKNLLMNNVKKNCMVSDTPNLVIEENSEKSVIGSVASFVIGCFFWYVIGHYLGAC